MTEREQEEVCRSMSKVEVSKDSVLREEHKYGLAFERKHGAEHLGPIGSHPQVMLEPTTREETVS